jgi:IS30 family transposase
MHTGQRRKRFDAAMLSVHDRPFYPVDRSEPGHREGDSIVGPAARSVIGT